MTLDIIIPAYNCLDTIDKALASIAMQKIDSTDEIKVYLVDDASTNGGYECVADAWKELLDISIIKKEKNEGCGRARQTGVENSHGEYFMFVDADDALFSPFSCRELLEMMTSGDYDMGMGMFVEETPDKKYVNHAENFTWCHGKIYRREFIEKNGIKFSHLRRNEDVAYNSLIHALTDKVIYMPRLVYAWQNFKGSLVRTDVLGYALDFGFRDFVEAITIAVEDMVEKGVDGNKIQQFEASMLAKFYWNYLEAKMYFPDKEKLNIKKIRDFYARTIRLHTISEGMLEYQYIVTTNEMKPEFIPDMTYKDFVRRIKK